MKKIYTFALLLLICFHSIAQNVAINNSSAPPDASAILDVNSNIKGILIPRMTQSQRLGILNPANGLLVYQSDVDSGFYFNAGSAAVPNWLPLQSKLTGWSTKGNSGTNSLTNFLGTTDAQPLMFRY